MESDHGSGQDRSQVWTMKGVSDHTENCDCRKFQNNYANKLFVHPEGQVSAAELPCVNQHADAKDEQTVY